MRDAYIVTSIRTPSCKSNGGAFCDTRPEDLLSFVLEAAVAKTQNLEPADVEDILVGCGFPEAEQGLNIGRIAARMAKFPERVAAATLNRSGASGLEAIALAAARVMVGWVDVAMGGGVESSSHVPIGGNKLRPHPEHAGEHPDIYAAMGISAEKMAQRHGISRQEQDEFACRSHEKAARARDQKGFSEIVPTPATRFVSGADGIFRKKTFLQKDDDGIQKDASPEALAKLPPAFSIGGTVTTGNAGRISDGAAATVIMSANKLKELGLRPLAKLKYYTTVGCAPDETATAPLLAIPELLKGAGVALEDVGLFEINEDFAASTLYCLRELGLARRMNLFNVHGGAIALGHPLGCTGAKLCATLLAGMRDRGARYGVESMSVGGGMGAAVLFELCR